MYGFARNVDWTFVSTTDGDESSMTMEFMLNDYIKVMWDKDFKVMEIVMFKGGVFEVKFVVENKGKEVFDFIGSFYTYLSVDINVVVVGGLNGCKMLD